MDSIVLIASGVALLAFSHGVVILGKASRENHGSVYKIAGWFVIIASIIIMCCSALHSAMHYYDWQNKYNSYDGRDWRGMRTIQWMRGHDGYYDYNHDYGRRTRYWDDDDIDRDYYDRRSRNDNRSQKPLRDSYDTTNAGRPGK